MVQVQPLWKIFWIFLTRFGITYDPAIQLLGIYTQEKGNFIAIQKLVPECNVMSMTESLIITKEKKKGKNPNSID